MMSYVFTHYIVYLLIVFFFSQVYVLLLAFTLQPITENLSPSSCYFVNDKTFKNKIISTSMFITSSPVPAVLRGRDSSACGDERSCYYCSPSEPPQPDQRKNRAASRASRSFSHAHCRLLGPRERRGRAEAEEQSHRSRLRTGRTRRHSGTPRGTRCSSFVDGAV